MVHSVNYPEDPTRGSRVELLKSMVSSRMLNQFEMVWKISTIDFHAPCGVSKKVINHLGGLLKSNCNSIRTLGEDRPTSACFRRLQGENLNSLGLWYCLDSAGGRLPGEVSEKKN